MAVEDINKAGIKGLGGAKLEVMLGDAQSTPQAGAAEIEKMNEAGCAAVVGAYASAICWPRRRRRPSTTAARGGRRRRRPDRAARAQEHLPLRPRLCGLRPGRRGQPARAEHLAGKPAKTVMIIHEESLFGTGTANLLARELRASLRGQGRHQARQPDARLQQHRAAHEVGQPDIVIPRTTTTNTPCWCARCSSRR